MFVVSSMEVFFFSFDSTIVRERESDYFFVIERMLSQVFRVTCDCSQISKCSKIAGTLSYMDDY